MSSIWKTIKAVGSATEAGTPVIKRADAAADAAKVAGKVDEAAKVASALPSGRVVYHGTDAEEFKDFKPGTWFTESPSEASAYSFAVNLARREKALQKYSIKSGASYADNELEYHVTLSEIPSPEKGKVYATDSGVLEYQGEGRWSIFHDLAPDYSTYKKDTSTIKVVKSDFSEDAEVLKKEYDEWIKEKIKGGERGRVYPVHLDIKNPILLPPLEANRIANRMGMNDPEIESIINRYKREGYDGIETWSDEASFNPEVANEMGGVPKQYIIFDSSQARPAVGSKAK